MTPFLKATVKRMKNGILFGHVAAVALSGVLVSCSGPAPDEAWRTEVPLDTLVLTIGEPAGSEQHSELRLSDSEKAELRAWLLSLVGCRADFNSYAPSVMLEGEGFRILFARDRTVIAFRDPADPAGTWSQYSRAATAEDQRILGLLTDRMP